MIIDKLLNTSKVKHWLDLLLCVLLHKKFCERPSSIEKYTNWMNYDLMKSLRIIVLDLLRRMK